MIKLGNKCMLFNNVLFNLMTIGKMFKHFAYIENYNYDGWIYSDDANVYDESRIAGDAQVYDDCVFVS